MIITGIDGTSIPRIKRLHSLIQMIVGLHLTQIRKYTQKYKWSYPLQTILHPMNISSDTFHLHLHPPLSLKEANTSAITTCQRLLLLSPLSLPLQRYLTISPSLRFPLHPSHLSCHYLPLEKKMKIFMNQLYLHRFLQINLQMFIREYSTPMSTI